MPVEEFVADIRTSVVETEEPTFKPGEKKIEVVLQPLPEEEPYYPPYEPYEPLPPYDKLPFLPLTPPKKSVILDIETTGANPWDSRIISIGVRDVDPGKEIMIFSDPDEKIMLEQFISWYTSQGFNEIIGYNVSFDYRFIYAKCLRYLVKCGAWFNSSLFDLMNVMKQVKREFVYGYNKPGSLGEWAAYLWNEKKLLSISELLKAWKDKRIEEILEHNKHDVELVYLLWLTVNYVEEVGVLG